VDGSTGGVISEWESSRTCQETGQLTGTELTVIIIITRHFYSALYNHTITVPTV
jgi:hypothetical protein